MKILFECDNGAYVVEVHSGRLYAKVEEDKALPIRYSSTISPLLNPASFHEYRGEDAMLQKKLDKALTKTQKKSLESGMLKESEKEAGSQSVEPNGVENLGTDKIETSILPVNYETVYQGFQNISPDLKSAEYEVERARYDYKIAKGRLLPSLSLGGGISTNYYKNLSQKGQYDGFASQFRNNQGEYLALTLSIPIYNSDRWHSVKKARNDWQLAQVNLEETRRKLHDQIAQAVMDAEGYAKELHQMQKKVTSDSLAYHMSSRKFEEGMLSTFDLHTAAQTLLESRIKELQMQMLLIIKQRLVAYYQGENLIK